MIRPQYVIRDPMNALRWKAQSGPHYRDKIVIADGEPYTVGREDQIDALPRLSWASEHVLRGAERGAHVSVLVRVG